MLSSKKRKFEENLSDSEVIRHKRSYYPAIIYCKVNEIEDCKRFCIDNNYSFDKVVEDTLPLLKILEENKNITIIIYSIDILSRDTNIIFEYLDRNNLRIVSVSQLINLNNELGRNLFRERIIDKSYRKRKTYKRNKPQRISTFICMTLGKFMTYGEYYTCLKKTIDIIPEFDYEDGDNKCIRVKAEMIAETLNFYKIGCKKWDKSSIIYTYNLASINNLLDDMVLC